MDTTTLTPDQKNLLYDFVCWLVEQKKFSLATEVEGEFGREWVPILTNVRLMFKEYQEFVETKGPARTVFGQYGWSPLEDLERDYPVVE